MGKQKRPRQKAQAAKMEAKKSASAVDTEMDVDSKEVVVGSMQPKGVSFKNTKANLEGQLTKIDKRALRQRILMQKLVVGGSGNIKQKDSVSVDEDDDDDNKEVSRPSEALLKRLGKRKQTQQNLKTKDKPFKKAPQRRKQYIHNVLKINTQVNKKTSKDMTHQDISERVKNLVAKLQQ